MKTDVALPTAELVRVLQSSLYPGASDASVQMVLSYCAAAGLDPMLKPVHIVPMWDSKTRDTRDVIMPGIGLYRTQASRTAQMGGVSEPEFGPDVTEEIGGQQITYPAWCRVTVKRVLPDGFVAEFTAREFWRENFAVRGGKERSVAPNAMWSKRPYGQLAKCAEAQALRKAFPELGSMPTADEMEGKEINMGAADVVSTERNDAPPAPPVAPEKEAYPADRFEQNLPKWVSSGRTAEEMIAMIETRASLSEAQKEAMRKAFAIDTEKAA